MGALLASHGHRTVVVLRPESNWECDAVVIDTESRELDQATAAERVRLALQQLRDWGARTFFKKVDSTLRGPIEAELEAFSPFAFTPAYPAMGRIVRGGVLYVNGMPVESQLRMLDASSDEDLERIVALYGSALAGSGGLGRAWVRSLPTGKASLDNLWRPEKPIVICGSRHAASRAQADRAEASGLFVIRTPEETGNSSEVARAIASQAAQLDADLLIIFGGDTSAAVLQAMGIHELWPVNEILPGIAASISKSRMIVTKAGGFGDPGIVNQILRELP